MTSPNFDVQGARDALDNVSQMLVGTKQLQDEPGVLFSLASQQARPQDAQAVDQFMQGLDVEKRVTLARQTGEKIVLAPTEKQQLTANGVAYNDVEYTQKNAAQDAAKLIEQQTGGKATAKLNPDGTLALDAHGNIQAVSHESRDKQVFEQIVHSAHHNFFDSVGGALKSAAGGVVEGVTKVGNFAQTEASRGLHALANIPAGLAGNANPNDRTAQVPDDTTAQDMEAAGYDPGSIWSQLAFAASGKAHTSLGGLNDEYGADKVTEALKFLNDPKAYRESLLGDPANYVKTADGQTALTPDAEAKLKYIGSKEFQNLAKRVNGSSATVGNDLANAVGLDPVAHSTAYGITAAVSNIAASFAIDPTLMALQGVKVAKLAAVGLDTLGDSDRAASILLRDSKLPWVNNVQRGWKKAIDYGEQMRQAHAAGDVTQLAKLTAQFNAELPGLSPIMGDFIGKNALTGWSETVENGRKVVKPVFGETDGIRSLEDAAKWVQTKQGLNLLMNGRAATQASLMPGAVSAFGYRSLKGMTAGWMTGRSATRAAGAYAEAEGRLASASQDIIDAWKAKGLITEQDLARWEPHADDAIDANTDTVLNADRYELTAAGKGEVARNLRQTGDVLGDSTVGYMSPTAIAARARLAAQRFTTLLPRNTRLDINDVATADKVYKYALTYLNRGDAQALRAAWNVGNPGQRKAIVSGLLDQVGHAAGLSKTETGREILARASTADEHYATAGDDLEVNGERLGLFEGQTRQAWTLPTFQAIHSASKKFGMWEAILGRPMTSQQADMLMGQWKMGALFKPSTVTRNQLEGWLRTILEGRAGDAIQARAVLTARNKELWDRGFGTEARDQYIRERGNVEGLQSLLSDGGLSQEQRANTLDRIAESKRQMATLEDHPIVQHMKATEAGDMKLAKQIEQGSMLHGQVLGRGKTMTRLADLAPLAVAGRAYRALVGKFMDEETVDALLTLTPQELADAMEGYGQQILESELGFRNAAKQATEIAKAGYGPSSVRYVKEQALAGRKAKLTAKELRDHEDATGEKLAGIKWTHQATDGTIGADRYANALHQRVDAMPETARAAIAHLTDPEHDIQNVVAALEKESKNTAFGKVFFDDPAGNPTKGRWAINDEEVAQGKTDWARSVVNEYSALLHGQNGELQKELADYITEHGTAPDADWISGHMLNDHRPAGVLAPEVMAMPNGGITSLPQTLQDVEGAAYKWIVERPLQRTTSSPVFMANYAIARKGLNKQVEKLIESGVSREAAENMAKETSIRNAWIKTEQLIDDPGQKTQFDVVARNMFPFARATNAMVRRWGTGLWQNPAAARKLMLSYEGAVHSGLIYDNVYGEPTFTYPGSGVMNMVMRGIAQLPGFEDIAAFPVASDMTGGVQMAVPGADNPFRMSMGPMLSVPLRTVYKNLLPTSWQGELTKLDEQVNGPVGQGETWQQFVPTAVRKFYVALSADDRNSAMASAMNGAFANLAAAGLVPSTENADSEVAQRFRTRLQTQVQSQLFLRAVFGLFAPAAPSAPTEGTSVSGADYAWSVDGIKQLSDEYKVILNETGGDVGRANAVFTALHPDEVVYKTDGAPSNSSKLPASAYETTRSTSTVKGAYLPSTDSALQWMTTHEGFIKQYSSVAAYFLPNSTSGEPFSDAAYQTQLELGLRQRKTPTEFMNDVYLKHAESTFYPTIQLYDRKIADAKASGDTATASYWTQAKSDWEKSYQNLNPLLKAKIDNYGNARAVASRQLTDLQHMYDNNAVPDGQRAKLGQLLQTYKNYEELIAQHKGSDSFNTTVRSNALDMVNQWAVAHLTGTPLADVYNGVFRTLNTNLTKIGGGN